MKNKKVVSLFLATIMAVGCLAGCGNEKQTQSSVAESQTEKESESSVVESEDETVAELEPVTLKFYLRGAEMEGSADVEEAFNAKLAEALPNTTVEFTFVEGYGEKWPLFMSGGEVIDIAWAGWETPFEQDVADGNVLPLNDLVEKYAPNLQKEWATWQTPYNTAVKDGVLYGVPGVQPLVNETQWFKVSEGFAKYLDVDKFVAELRSNRKVTSALLDIIEEGIETAIAEGAFTLGKADWGAMARLELAARGYVPLGAQRYNMYFDPLAENPEPLHMWEIPEVKMLLNRFAEWYDRGWYTETQMLEQLPVGALGTVDFEWTYNMTWANVDEKGSEFIEVQDKENYYKIASNTPSEGYVGTFNFGAENTYLVIPYTAENPERAIMLIDLLRAEDGIGLELINMLCYGFEETSEEAKEYGWFNYTAVEKDGQMTVDTSTRGDAASKHNVANWMIGNTFKTMHDGGALTTVAAKEYAMNYFVDVYPSLTVTPIAGMNVDYSELSNECGAIDAVMAEYKTQLRYGGGGTDKVEVFYADVMKKLNEVGLEKVKEVLQAQIDEYMK